MALLFLFATGIRSLLAVAAPEPTPDQNPEGNTGALKSQVTTGGSYDAHSGNATRIVNDLHVPGALGTYGLDFTRYWNSVHCNDNDENAEWPVDFGESGWSHSWKWTAVYDDEIVGDGEISPDMHRTWITSITITYPDGHASKFKIYRVNFGSGPHDFRAGPPYIAPGERDWPELGTTVHDHLAEMDYNGYDFWLRRGDGGTVHFTGGPVHYQATEVFDPHGLKTELIYNQAGYLQQVKQDNRWLTLTWQTFYPYYVVPFITKVETGGDAAGQEVNYGYVANGGYHVLASVSYPNQPNPGQTTSAIYIYGYCLGDTEPCPGEPHSGFPLLKTAYDPHFAGAMTKIRYNYGGGSCYLGNGPGPTPPPSYHDNVFFNTEETIAAEKSESGTIVSSWMSSCGGERFDDNGIGGRRKFYFGSSANDPEIGAGQGYELMKVTNFALPGTVSPISQKQRGNEPSKVWDGRHNYTNFVWGDASGSPSQIDYMDGGHYEYDRVHPSAGTSSLDPIMHNTDPHFLFTKNENGFPTTYVRDGRRRVTDIFYPDGSSEHYLYNEWNQVTSHTLPSGVIQTYQYDLKHRLEVEYNSADFAVSAQDYRQYTYYEPGDPEGPGWADLVKTMTDGRARVNGATFSTKMTYNGRQQIMSVEYASNTGTHPTVHYQYDPDGNCIAIIDEMEHRKEYTYDSYRRCTSSTEWLFAPNWNGSGTQYSRRWDWIYDRVIKDVGQYPASAHTKNEWRVQIEPVFNATGERRTTTRAHDLENRIVCEQTGWIQPSSLPIGNWYPSADLETHWFSYDENGQKQTYKDPLNRVTTYTYDTRNRLKDTIEPKRRNQTVYPTTTIEYWPTGDKKKVTFPDGRFQQWFDYDAFGQPRRFEDERHHTTNLDYWPWGPMKKLHTVTTHRAKDGGGIEDQVTTFYPDLMGRQQWTYFPDTTFELIVYEFGQVSAFRNRRTQTKRLHYDVRGREDYHTWDNDAAPGITRVWDNANRLSSIANSVSTIQFGYDDASQVLSEQNNVVGTNSATINYLRYPSGEVAHLQYPNGTWMRRDYTARGQLQFVQDSSGQQPIHYYYLPDGKVDYQVYPNGVTTTFGYDGRGMIGSVQHRNVAAGQDLARRDYWRDDRDRIVAWKRGTDRSLNQMEDGRGDRFDYDEEGQLISASYRAATPDGTPSGAVRTDSFQYDELGNRMGLNYVASRGAWMNILRRDNGLNQYKSWDNDHDHPPPYDPLHWGSGTFYDDNIPAPSPSPSGTPWPWVSPGNGVLMQDGYVTAGFNALNQPTAIWSKMYQNTSNWMFFGYDPLGRCVKRWVSSSFNNSTGATFFFYDGWNLIQEGPNAAATNRLYVHGARVDEIVATQVDGTWYYNHYDAQGNCIVQSMTNGGIQAQFDYDAFGFPYFYNAVGGKGTPKTRFLFTGREYLSDLRLYDYRNRMYQPELGRFLQPDPKGFAAGDYNLYRYCHNDPVNRVDPTGLRSEIVAEVQQLQKRLGSNMTRWVTIGTLTTHYSGGSWQAAAYAAAGAAALMAHNTDAEHYGIVVHLANSNKFYATDPIPSNMKGIYYGGHAQASGLGTLQVPGFKTAAGYWSVAGHMDLGKDRWPTHQDGSNDLDVLKASHMNAVLAIPGMRGSSHAGEISYREHGGEPDYVYPKDKP